MKTESKYLWEILIPVEDEFGDEIPKKRHKKWDEKISDISGGYTILKPAKGQWICPESGELFAEPMIPVRMVCTRHEMFRIAEMTKVYYKQLKVFVYRIADEVYFI